jgi:thiosulfate/3-mercaptopyruvate sulfurtransferase
MPFTTLIDVIELRRLLCPAPATSGTPGAARPPVLLDCRFDLTAPGAGREAYLRGHLPGAHYADLNLDLAGQISATSGRHPLPTPDSLARRCAQFGIERDVQVVAYDEVNGSFAARAWWLLRWLGHRQVAVLDGGYRAWLADGGELESGAMPAAVSLATAAPVTAVVDRSAVLTADDVLRALADPSRVLVDARAAERYAGTVEPIDPVAGHVPGAVNHPFADNLGTDGHFLAPAELRRRWEARLAGKAPENAILMCGSGVTACHDLLALEVAGLPGAKLYAGSWSEWIRDPSRPVTQGSAA